MTSAGGSFAGEFSDFTYLQQWLNKLSPSGRNALETMLRGRPSEELLNFQIDLVTKDGAKLNQPEATRPPSNLAESKSGEPLATEEAEGRKFKDGLRFKYLVVLYTALSVATMVELLHGFGTEQGDEFEDGKNLFDEFESLLESALPDPSRWDGSGADEYAAADQKLIDAATTVKGLDEETRDCMKSQSDTIVQSRRTIGFCVGGLTAAIPCAAAIYAQPWGGPRLSYAFQIAVAAPAMSFVGLAMDASVQASKRNAATAIALGARYTDAQQMARPGVTNVWAPVTAVKAEDGASARIDSVGVGSVEVASAGAPQFVVGSASAASVSPSPVSPAVGGDPTLNEPSDTAGGVSHLPSNLLNQAANQPLGSMQQIGQTLPQTGRHAKVVPPGRAGQPVATVSGGAGPHALPDDNTADPSATGAANGAAGSERAPLVAAPFDSDSGPTTTSPN